MIGLDTVKLRLVDYEVSSSCRLDVRRPDFNAGTGEEQPSHVLWCDTSGRLIQGTRAYHNADDFNVTVGPIMAGRELVRGIGCWVQFSVPKCEGENNYHPTNHQGTRAALKRVEKSLGEAGIRTNIDTAQLGRVDTFRNVVAAEPFMCYQPVFSLLNAKRMPKRDYGTTFLWNNTQQEICVYDKLEEMEHRKLDTKGYPSNTIRFEHRLLKSKKVSKALGVSTVGELCEGFNVVGESFRHTMKEQLFKHTFSQLQVLAGSRVEEGLRFFKERGDRYWFESWLNAASMSYVLQVASADVIKRAIGKVTDNRSVATKAVRKLEAVRLDAAALRRIGPMRKTLAEMYEELQTKVLAA